MATCLSSGEQITNSMREIRGKSIDEKKKIYLEERVKEQQDWYAKKRNLMAREMTIGLL